MLVMLQVEQRHDQGRCVCALGKCGWDGMGWDRTRRYKYAATGRRSQAAEELLAATALVTKRVLSPRPGEPHHHLTITVALPNHLYVYPLNPGNIFSVGAFQGAEQCFQLLYPVPMHHATSAYKWETSEQVKQ
jgi:hypothetical protein